MYETTIAQRPVSHCQWVAMNTLIRIFVVLLMVGTFCCRNREPVPAESQSAAQCMSELNKIPVLAAILNSQKQDEANNQKQPLEGMEVALTINGMILSKGEPEKGIDDWCESENSLENFNQLVIAMRENQLPPTVAFVSGRYLDLSLLSIWIENGNQVGSLTFSQKRSGAKPASMLIEDIKRNEQALAPLWSKHRREKKYFRFPQLKNSSDASARLEVERYLKEQNFLVVSGTIAPQSSPFNQLYCAALSRNEATCVHLIKDCYKKLVLDSMGKARALAKKRFGRDIKHILVVKADQFLCDNLSDLLRWLKGLGVKFISVDEALTDAAYAAVTEDGRSTTYKIISDTKRRQLAQGERKDRSR